MSRFATNLPGGIVTSGSWLRCAKTSTAVRVYLKWQVVGKWARVPQPRMSDVTRILESIGRGDAEAAEQLLPLVYEELRKLAAHKMANEAPGHTLQPTALVHEAWLRLVGSQEQ